MIEQEQVTGEAGPWALVPVWVADAVDPTALALYVKLAGMADRRRSNSWTIGKKSLAEELKVSTKTVQRCLRRLEEIGALEISTTVHQNGQGWNRYFVKVSPPNPRTVRVDMGVQGGLDTGVPPYTRTQNTRTPVVVGGSTPKKGTTKRNKYAAPCSGCGKTVRGSQGHLVRLGNGSWGTLHDGCSLQQDPGPRKGSPSRRSEDYQ